MRHARTSGERAAGRRAACGLAIVCVGLAPPVAAQVGVAMSAGARFNTVLVHDQIVTAFNVRPALAPAVSLTATLPLDRPWTASAMLDVSTSEVRREDQGGGSQPITHLTTAALTVGLTRSLKSWLTGSLRIGVIKYFPSQDLGLFQNGGPFFPLAQAAFDVAPPFAARRGLALELRADGHKFITDALRVEGFSDARPVGRVAVALVWTPGTAR